MGWIEDESTRLFCPCLADVFVGCQALQGLEPASKVVGGDEVGEVAAQLVVGFIVVALDRYLFEGGSCVRPGRWSRDASAWSGGDRCRSGRRPVRRRGRGTARRIAGRA